MKICFLFNHDAAHQVAHSIGLAAVLAEKYQQFDTTIAYGSPAIRKEIEQYLTPEQIQALNWADLSLGKFLQACLSPLNRLFPAQRLLRLLAGAKYLRPFDLIVSTERTCLMLKRRWGDDGPDFAYIPHGSGDRNVAYHPALKDFDLMLLSGQKLVDQMVAHDIVPAEKCRVIGYPKFDGLIGRAPEKFFDNENPMFLYNPHFDPYLSSWYDEGEAILDWFYQRPDQFNLIFAPHVMLFFKSTHISPEYKKSRRRPDVAQKYLEAENIRVDTDSPRLFDMSYTIAADAYIGDVSSQVYEFLYRARPVYFIDTHSGGHSAQNPAYEFWLNGPVVTGTDDLFPLLEKWRETGAEYRAEQGRLMNYTADRSDPRPASERGAEAIAQYLSRDTDNPS
ncbi:hypothetical protein MNBD_ALPHA04-51 [hydrothermal vent metagenome]|uniref:Uncharacterized protein n=1 Tax=hydrothermal vent metagenome TaxID=652676 RepID=A0A3B0RCC6_9ZZZZ